ncbi:hypothetical protein D3C77_501490 [compost metagenome]
MLGDAEFQQQVLAVLNNIESLPQERLKEAQQDLVNAGVLVNTGEGKVEIAATFVEPTTAQSLLDQAATLNEYLQKHPEKAEAVGWILALAQGPKAVMQMVAEQALSMTDAGEVLLGYLALLQEQAGQFLAEGMEGAELDSSYENEARLIGGGGLLAGVLLGGLPGGRG